MTLANGYFLNQGRYQVQAPLGRGGMGTVYRAVDHNLAKRVVAIKENIDTDANSQQQFRQEALMLASLTHPNLPRVTDHFIEPSQFQYLVMDYIEGYNLDQIVQKRGGPIPERSALAWIEQIMNALEYMHTWPIKNSRQSAPIIHRDIKPSNIKRRRDGRVILVDFGLAKYHTGQATSIGARGATPGYSPAEQYSGGTDVRSDIYALGATLYKLLTTAKPPDALVRKMQQDSLPAPRTLNPTISPNVERVIQRAMQIQPADRYQSVAAMRADLHLTRRLPIKSADNSIKAAVAQPRSARGTPKRDAQRRTAQARAIREQSTKTRGNRYLGPNADQGLLLVSLISVVVIITLIWFVISPPRWLRNRLPSIFPTPSAIIATPLPEESVHGTVRTATPTPIEVIVSH